MPIFIDTRGHSTLAVAICARCKVKYPRDELTPDPNSPGLLCCPDGCLDQLDPWRLPPKGQDRLTVDQPRPDTPLYPLNPISVYVTPLEVVVGANNGDVLATNAGDVIAAAPPVTALAPAAVWSPNTYYTLGSQVTPPNTSASLVPPGETVQVLTCVFPGQSGVTSPIWPTTQGVAVEDNGVIWFSTGICLLDGFGGTGDSQ